MKVVVISQAERELRKTPKDVLLDVYSLFDELEKGKHLRMPISRPLPGIGKGLHELRLSSKAGEYRVFYLIKIGTAIYVLHATTKKKQKIDQKTTDLLRKRIKDVQA
jgi:phage-related protein